MPSVNDKMCVLNNPSKSSETASPPQPKTDFFSKDMENLVSEIKENLKLSTLKVKSQRRVARCSPYIKPSQTCDDTTECSCSPSKSKCSHVSCSSKRYSAGSGLLDARKLRESSDPYEMLQELLKDGSLIKEAVRRLQKGLSPKQRYFYESEDDSARSSPHPKLDFVC